MESIHSHYCDLPSWHHSIPVFRFKSFKSAGLRPDEVLAGRKSKAQVETLTYAALILAVSNARMTAAPIATPKSEPKTAAKPDAQGAPSRSLLKSAKLVSLLLLVEWLGTDVVGSLSTRLLDLLTRQANYDQ